MNITVKRQTNGRYVAQVRKDNGKGRGVRIVFETPEYLTKKMAQADARCWLAFNAPQGETTMTYTIALDPIDNAFGRQPLKGEYATKEEAWEAVQHTAYSEPVTVLENGQPVATFTWLRKSADEVTPRGYSVRVRDLCKWTRQGWERTGVQALGVNSDRRIRTVAL